jgi:hypothetical protein
VLALAPSAGAGISAGASNSPCVGGDSCGGPAPGDAAQAPTKRVKNASKGAGASATATTQRSRVQLAQRVCA